MTSYQGISARLSPEEYQELQSLAKETGYSQNTILRILISEAANLSKEHKMRLFPDQNSRGACVVKKPEKKRFRGDLLRAYRLALGLPRETIAEAIGVSPSAIARWEDESRRPTIENAQAVSAYLQGKLDTEKSAREDQYAVLSTVE
jgi:transcriptional regulator with XRE-family HTH domain